MSPNLRPLFLAEELVETTICRYPYHVPMPLILPHTLNHRQAFKRARTPHASIDYFGALSHERLPHR